MNLFKLNKNCYLNYVTRNASEVWTYKSGISVISPKVFHSSTPLYYIHDLLEDCYKGFYTPSSGSLVKNNLLKSIYNTLDYEAILGI